MHTAALAAATSDTCCASTSGPRCAELALIGGASCAETVLTANAVPRGRGVADLPIACCAELALTSGAFPCGLGVADLPATACCAARSDRDRVAQAFIAAALRLTPLLPELSTWPPPPRGRHRRDPSSPPRLVREVGP